MTKIENIAELKGFLWGFGIFGVKEGENTYYGLIAPDGKIVLGPHPTGSLCDEAGNPVKENRHDEIYACRFCEGFSIIERGGDVVRDKQQRIRITRDAEGNYSVVEEKYRIPQWMLEHRHWFDAFSLNGRLIFHEDVFSFGPAGAYLRLKLMDDGPSFKQILTDEYFRPILPDIYDQVADNPYISSGTPISVRKGEDWFVIDLSGKRLSEKRYDYLECFTADGYAIFGARISEETNEYDDQCAEPEGRYRFGLMDAQERVIIPPVYETLCWIGDDYKQLCCSAGLESCGGLFGVMDCAGSCIIPRIYPHSLTKGPADTYIACSEAGTNGLLGPDGKILLPFRNWEIAVFENAIRVYDHETKCYGLYSPAEGWLMPCEYDEMDIGDTLDYIAVRKTSEWYYANRHGERVLL